MNNDINREYFLQYPFLPAPSIVPIDNKEFIDKLNSMTLREGLQVNDNPPAYIKSITKDKDKDRILLCGREDDLITDTVKRAKRHFCNGIYVPCNVHPCGWDFISFEDINIEDDLSEVKIELCEISNGVYDEHPFVGLTLKDILAKTKGVFAFELSGIDWI